MNTYTLTVMTTEGIEIITDHDTMNSVQVSFARIAAAAAGCLEWSEILNNETGELEHYDY